jgi:sterol desaturase/sphingolipid hydroxylase (fatty acid hydroxylase superfamily)
MMADVTTEQNERVDGVARDDRGFWQPARGTAPPNPLFAWPPRPLDTLKWVKGYLFPWNLLYMAVATATWLYWQPALSRCVEFRADWIGEMFIRNEIMLVVIVSAWHLRFWSAKKQGLKYKYTADWMAVGNRKFLGGSQLRDNVFWSCVSGGIIWTAYEAIMMWAYANEMIPYVNPREEPIYFVLLLCGIQLWRLFHFYWAHRITHWPPLYKSAHYLHHKNINIGPWSGLSMHPIEHVIYFSCILIHWVVPSHPIHMLMNAQHAAFTPAQGHVGFEKVLIAGDRGIPAASYFHQMHHRYFECNYGEPDFPFDNWFGTHHDGSPEAHAAFREKRKLEHSIEVDKD